MGKILEEYRGYYIKKTFRDYVITTKDEEKHSHFKRLEHCRLLIDLMSIRKVPRKKYFIMAAIRLLDEGEYLERLKLSLESFEAPKNCVKRTAGKITHKYIAR